MNRRILLIGGGGHCKSVLDSLIHLDQYEEIGIIDTTEKVGESVLNIPILGCDNDLEQLYHKGYEYAFVAIGASDLRSKLFDIIKNIGFIIPNIMDISAVVSRYVTMGNGIYIGKNAVINADTYIGNGTIVNTSATIEHDCFIDEYSHVSPGAVLCGGVKIGKNTHIGSGSVIKQQISIGSNTIIGMGSVVLKDIGSNVVAYGNPCKEVRR